MRVECRKGRVQFQAASGLRPGSSRAGRSTTSPIAGCRVASYSMETKTRHRHAGHRRGIAMKFGTVPNRTIRFDRGT